MLLAPPKQQKKAVTWNDNLGSDRIDGGSTAPVFQLSDSKLNQLQDRRTDSVGGRSPFPYGDLTKVMSKVLSQRHPPLTALKHFPLSTEAGWAEKLELYSMNDHGSAKIVCCSTDFPRVGFETCTWQTGFVNIGTGYRICYDTLKAQGVSRMNINVQANLLRVAIRALREKANALAYHGSMADSVLGIKNNIYIPTMVSPFKLDNTQSAQDILSVLVSAANEGYVSSNMSNYLYNAVIGPPSLMRNLGSRLMSITGDAPTSLLQQFGHFAPQIQYFGESWELENAGPNGERMMFFYRRDPGCIEWHFPVALEMLEPFWTGYEWEQNIIARVGSVWPYYPEDCLRLVGV